MLFILLLLTLHACFVQQISLLRGGNISVIGHVEIVCFSFSSHAHAFASCCCFMHGNLLFACLCHSFGLQNNTESMHYLTLLICTDEQLDNLSFTKRLGCQPIDTPCLVATNFSESIHVFVSLLHSIETTIVSCVVFGCRLLGVPRYDSFNVLVANCAPSIERLPYNISANVTYMNANGHLPCEEMAYPVMYDVFSICWAVVIVFLVHRILRDHDAAIQQNFRTKNGLTAIVGFVAVMFGVHAQVSSAYYKLADKNGIMDEPPFRWLLPLLYVAREMTMYGTVLTLSVAYRVSFGRHCRERLLFSFGALDIDAFFAFLFSYPRNQYLVCSISSLVSVLGVLL